MIDVEVTEDRYVPGCSIGTLLKAGVRERIHHDMVVCSNEALYHPETGTEACWIENRFFHGQELSDSPLERH